MLKANPPVIIMLMKLLSSTSHFRTFLGAFLGISGNATVSLKW